VAKSFLSKEKKNEKSANLSKCTEALNSDIVLFGVGTPNLGVPTWDIKYYNFL
jgi:hypothetical protein